MKLKEKLAKDWVEYEFRPSTIQDLESRIVAEECFLAGFEAARKLVAYAVTDETYYRTSPINTNLIELGEGEVEEPPYAIKQELRRRLKKAIETLDTLLVINHRREMIDPFFIETIIKELEAPLEKVES